MLCVPTSRLVCTEPGRTTRAIEGPVIGAASIGAAIVAPVFFQPPNAVSAFAFAWASVMSPATASTAWSGT